MKIIPGEIWLWDGHAFHTFVICDGVLTDVQYKKVPQKDEEEDKHRIVPDGVKRIATNAFNCDDITTQITLPESLETIEENAFRLCESLRMIHIPASVTHIGEGAFDMCKKVRITVDKKNPRYKVIGKCLVDMIENKLIAIMSASEPVIPEFITKLGHGFICNSNRIKKITIPEGIKELPNYAFHMCDKLEEVAIHSELKVFGEGVFQYCKKLKKIEFPDGVKELPGWAFNGCKKLEEVILPEGLKVIPTAAFYDCNALCNISIPSSVTHIGCRAFGDCESLENLVFPDGITHIEQYAFSHCKNLTQITLPQSLVHLAENAFEYTKISELKIKAPAGSYAIQYAKENGLQYEET